MLLALLSGFLVYSCLTIVVVAVLIFRFAPRYGRSHMIIYIGICSLMGSLTVRLPSLNLKSSFNTPPSFEGYDSFRILFFRL